MCQNVTPVHRIFQYEKDISQVSVRRLATRTDTCGKHLHKPLNPFFACCLRLCVLTC